MAERLFLRASSTRRLRSAGHYGYQTQRGYRRAGCDSAGLETRLGRVEACRRPVPYDLVFDVEGALVRVQVKSAWFDEPSGNYVVDNRRTRTNRRVMLRSSYRSGTSISPWSILQSWICSMCFLSMRSSASAVRSIWSKPTSDSESRVLRTVATPG